MPRPRRAVGLIVIVAGLMLAAIGATVLLGSAAQPVPEIVLGARSPGFLVATDELRRRARLADQGTEPYASAVRDLLEFADRMVGRPASPQEPLEIRGTEGPFVDDSATAYGLALAYGVTGEERYADSAVAYIRAWVDTTRTTVGTCPDSGGCQTSLIISRTAPGFVFAADLLAGSVAWDSDLATRFATWLRAVILPTASELDNNWGDAGTFTRVVLTAYLDDRDGLRAALGRWYHQADLIAGDGHIPEETRRGSSGMAYTQESLQYRIGAAVVAERYGLDLWAYRNPGGSTLFDAVDYLAAYWGRPREWPWDDDARTPAPGPIWEIVYARSPDPGYVPIIETRRPYGAHGHSALRWTTLTNGVPFREPPSAPPT